MLQKLQQVLNHLHVDGTADRSSIIGARGLLSECPLYVQAVQQLSSNDVEGCTKDANRALFLKTEGNKSHLAGCFRQAACTYSEALRWLPAAEQLLEAARIHSNRALSLLQLAGSCTCCSCSKGCNSDRNHSSSSDACSAAVLARAAEQDCTAALACDACADSLAGKVLFRRARARLLLQQYAAAAEDAEAAAAAAQQAGDAPSAADAKQLLCSIRAAEAVAAEAGKRDAADHLQQLQLSMPMAGFPEVHPNLQQQQQQQCQQPASGPDLHRLNLLLQHHAWQAAQLMQQQQQQQQQRKQAPLRCCYSAAAGRHVVAAADILPGTLLLLEQPLAAVPVKRRRPRSAAAAAAGGDATGGDPAVAHGFCEWCFGPLGLAPWACTHCPQVQYCSSGCRAADATCPGGHQPGGPECGRPWARLLPEHARLASRCVAAAAAVRCKQGQQQQQQQQGVLSEQQVQQLRAELLSSLQQSWWAGDAASFKQPRGGSRAEAAADNGSSSSSSSREQLLEALLLSHLLSDIYQAAAANTQRNGSSSSSSSSSSEATSNPAALLKCLGQVVLNGVAIRPLLAGGSSADSGRQGLALYPAAALLNHSCDPNCSIRFEGRQLLLVCVRGAAAGQQLTISYGPQLGQQPTQLRQQLLLQQYGFVCCCSSCRKGLGLATEQQQQQQQGELAGPGSSCRPGACQLTDVQCQEAAASGFKCQSRSSCCPGAVLPEQLLPPGLAAEHPVHSGSSSSSSSSRGGGWMCSECGWRMPEQLQQQALVQLEAAAAAVAEAADLMGQHGAAAPTPQQQQHQQKIMRAMRLLQQAMSARRQFLHPQNQLLGASCHQTAAAAAAAAAVTASLTSPAASSLVLLQRSLQVSSASDVCSLLKALEQQLAALERLGLCGCPICSSAGKQPVASVNTAAEAAAEATPAAAVPLLPTRQQQQQLCQQLGLALEETCACRETVAGTCGQGLQLQQQELLVVVLQHLQGSVLAAVANLPPDALGTAAELLVAAAAVAALLDGTCSRRGCQQLDAAVNRQMLGCATGAAPAAQHAPVEQQIGVGAGGGAGTVVQQDASPGPWCRRCTRLLRLALAWVWHVDAVVERHLGAPVAGVAS
uniref:SET domain-containing protein n=1 Tax=Tetradesmus obliquus TaxID=3088 RepID=A0A383VC07_TETOB|eukprot:jgi/Sobl393_1/17723/SZX63105.1